MKKKRTTVAQMDRQMAPLAPSSVPLLWHDPAKAPFRLVGFPFFEKDKRFRRLPVVAPGYYRESVDALAEHTAGGQVAFRSDSSRLAIRVELAGPANMNHMPATGQCGFDLYIGQPLAQRFHKTAKYDHRKTSYEALLFENPESRMRNFTLNFPLYQGVKRLRIGLVPGAKIAPPPPWSTKGRIVIYGTSITQGGCACRPGMAYPNLLSRALNMEILNLGFSGNGRGEPEVIQSLAEIADPILFVLDYEANSAGMLEETLPQAIRILRKQHAHVPILVVSRIPFAQAITDPHAARLSQQRRKMMAGLVASLRRKGDRRVFFLDGWKLLGEDFDECTVDGVHPTDLGFHRMAKNLEPEFRRILMSNGVKDSFSCQEARPVPRRRMPSRGRT